MQNIYILVVIFTYILYNLRYFLVLHNIFCVWTEWNKEAYPRVPQVIAFETFDMAPGDIREMRPMSFYPFIVSNVNLCQKWPENFVVIMRNR